MCEHLQLDERKVSCDWEPYKETLHLNFNSLGKSYSLLPIDLLYIESIYGYYLISIYQKAFLKDEMKESFFLGHNSFPQIPSVIFCQLLSSQHPLNSQGEIWIWPHAYFPSFLWPALVSRSKILNLSEAPQDPNRRGLRNNSQWHNIEPYQYL